MIRLMTVIITLGFAVVMPSHAAWQVTNSSDPLSSSAGCILESDPVVRNDGYVETTVRLIFNGQEFGIVTDAPLDTEFNDMNVRVDETAAVPVARIPQRHTAVFEHPERLAAEFRKGLEAVVHLRLWPTWPSLGLVEFAFDLRGFTLGMESLTDC